MFTDHATVRLRQRGIPTVVVDWLLKYGSTAHDHRGARVIFFDKESRRRLVRAEGDQVTRSYGKFLNAYAVLTAKGNDVITVGHRYKRIYRS